MTWIDISLDADDIANESISIDIEDYIDDVDTMDLVDELKKRHDLTPMFRAAIEKFEMDRTRTPLRDTIICLLDLHTSATIEDIQEAIVEIYNK
jgi:hypothetical protein